MHLLSVLALVACALSAPLTAGAMKTPSAAAALAAGLSLERPAGELAGSRSNILFFHADDLGRGAGFLPWPVHRDSSQVDPNPEDQQAGGRRNEVH